ncbi:MAG TPA: hypothetical protein VF117_06610 [Gammaproteobacteria bacterium]
MDSKDISGFRSGGGHPRLLRCRMQDATRHGGVRYVELEQFTLWEHFMRTRHVMKVRDVELCLWVEKHEYARNPMVFEHAGRIDAVHLIEVSVCDPHRHYSVDVRRFADASDVPFVADLLLRHACNSVSDDACSVRITEGCCVRVDRISDRRDLLLGLTYGGTPADTGKAIRAKVG